MTNIDDLRKNAKDGASGDSSERGTSWKPKEAGDELAGVIEKIAFVHTDYGDKYVLNVRDNDDEGVLWALWVDGAVLKNRLLETAPGVGSLIVVYFEGKKDNKAGTFKYNSFQVAVSKPDCHDEWLAAREAFNKRSLLKAPDVGSEGITPEGDDDFEAPF